MRTIAVKAILQKAASVQNNNELQQILTGWFAWMNFEKWNTKWGDTNNINAKEMVQKHVDWINEKRCSFYTYFFY